MQEQINNNPDYPCLISDGIQFLESLSRIYGPERAHEVWLSMKDAMGREVQMDIFSAMLKGDIGGRINFRVVNSNSAEAVNTIKVIREYSGCGLKEAKDLWDKAKSSRNWEAIEYNASYQPSMESRSQFGYRIRRRLRDLGHEVR